ncbi:DUF3426 domain-containing protein [Psychrobacter vallis]|uniref:DUF3426 domain-containing protein n=1 Tax=Psychrobacter vallis TaxID=248451 RepID=UPI00191A3356|nr:DUF3426 domain-containing protein [Psychrobacter vallis]
MTTPIKTQCPHCQACFKIQQTQLNKENSTVSCQHCQQSFLVNEHLIVTPDVPNTSTAQTDTKTPHINGRFDPRTHSAAPTKAHNKNQNGLSDSKSSLNKRHEKHPSSDTLIHDDLIYDDMDIEESDDNVLEYDSLDSMDAWLTQASYASTAAHKPSNQSYKVDNKNNSDAPLKKTSSTAITEPTVLSSTAANNIHANIDNTADNSWLEQLLKEQNKKEDTPTDDTDLSQLLLEMGVPLKDDETLEERMRKSQAKFVPASDKHSIASLLWTLGCLVLALLLFAQYVIFNLETLVKNPAHAQRLQAICSIAACSLPSADLTAFTMTKSNHDSSQIKNTAAFSDVSATLTNQSEKSQLYPNVKVSVYSANNLIGTFIATPTDYLLSKQHHLAANSEQKLLFTIPVPNTQIREVTISPFY